LKDINHSVACARRAAQRCLVSSSQQLAQGKKSSRSKKKEARGETAAESAKKDMAGDDDMQH